MLNVLHGRFAANPAQNRPSHIMKGKKAQMSTVSHWDWIRHPHLLIHKRPHPPPPFFPHSCPCHSCARIRPGLGRNEPRVHKHPPGRAQVSVCVESFSSELLKFAACFFKFATELYFIYGALTLGWCDECITCNLAMARDGLF